MALGITGGEAEEERGIPLCGPSGRKLSHAIAWASQTQAKVAGEGVRGFPFARYNLFNCRAIEVGKQGKVINRTKVTMRELRACASRWLFPDLMADNHLRVVLVLGTDVYKFLMGNPPLWDIFGKSMGHRMVIKRQWIREEGLERKIMSYGGCYTR